MFRRWSNRSEAALHRWGQFEDLRSLGHTLWSLREVIYWVALWLMGFAGLVLAVVAAMVGWVAVNLAAVIFLLAGLALLLATRGIGQWPEKFQAENFEVLADLAEELQQKGEQIEEMARELTDLRDEVMRQQDETRNLLQRLPGTDAG